MAISTIALAALAAAQAAAPQGDAPQDAAPQAGIQSAPAASIAPAAPQAAILAPTGGSVLRAGTEVPLRLEEGLDSNNKTIREGHRFRMTVANDVRLGNVVVIPAGSPATGEVTDLRRKGMWGKSGRIVARVINARVGDRLIRLTGSFDDKGVTGTAGVVGAIVFVPIAGFFLTGTSAKMPAGSGVKAFLDEDLAIAVPQPAPVATPVPVQAATPVTTAVQPQ
jgi:hypothetical protein